jgi:hypothetical protein
MNVSCPDECRLHAGPYAAPPLRVGDRETCIVRDALCVVTGWSAGRVQWPTGVPVGGRSGPGFIVTEELARAVRSESAKAIRWWFGVGSKAVAKWRRALGVTRTNNPGTGVLVRQASARGAAETRGRPLPPEQVEQRRQAALELDLGKHLRAGLALREVGPLWTAEELALLGTMPDEKVAEKTGRSVKAVTVKRIKLKIPTTQDWRKRVPTRDIAENESQ